MRHVSRVAAVAIAVVLAIGAPEVCEGLTLAQDARLACCAAEDACAMHPRDEHGAQPRPTSHPDADSCCAASGASPAGPSSATFLPLTALALSASPVPAVVIPPRVRFNRTSASPPLAVSRVSRHVLHSVFLL